jgi:hypothetical protein
MTNLFQPATATVATVETSVKLSQAMKLLRLAATAERLTRAGLEIDVNYLQLTITVYYITPKLELAFLTVDSVMLDNYSSSKIVEIVLYWLD